MKQSKQGWHHVTKEERKEIALYCEKGYNQADIAQMLRRSPSTISDELKRKVRGFYDPLKANLKAYGKRKYSKYQGMKVVEHAELRAYVEEKLKLDWSPEQIAGRIHAVDTNIPHITTDGIYKFIRSCYGGPLIRFLRYKGKQYKKSEAADAAPLTGRTFIDQRPKSIEKRVRFGHWEADFIVSGKNGSGALLVFVERKSRYVLIFKLANRKVATINLVLGKLLGIQVVVKSLTIDNDICFRHHPQMSRIIGAPIFFCHPYHSWEKGSVENMNKWIRQYVKKGSDISTYSDEYLQFVEHRLNNRPRKCLRFRTPREAVTAHQVRRNEIASMIKVAAQQKNGRMRSFGLRV